jgi:hypothetical protein
MASKNHKKNVKLSLCLTKYYTMKTYGGVDVLIQVLFTSAVVGGEWLASRPSAFTPYKRATDEY